jgi:uncharacterized protein
MGEAPASHGGTLQGAIVPVFPLPNVLLYPGCVMPLHIFEPRYRQMIEDLLDRSGRIAMGCIVEGELDEAGRPQVHPIAGLGEIARHERLPDGRYLVWLIGLTRARLHEVPSERLYRTARVETLEDFVASAESETRLRPKVQAALVTRVREQIELPRQMPFGHLVDLLLQRLPSVERRAEGALAAHELLPRVYPEAPDAD